MLRGLADIKMVMGAGTFGHAGTQYANTNKGDLSAVEKLAMITGGVKVSGPRSEQLLRASRTPLSGLVCAAIWSRRFGKASRLSLTK